MRRYYCALVVLIMSHTASFGQSSTEVFKYVEQMPEPTYNILEYLNTHIEYPEEARTKHIQGRVLVKFIVTENGTMDSVHTISSPLGGGLEEEAIRVVKYMPPWKPGRQNGKPVKVYFTQPISFQLNNSAIRPTNAAGH